MKQRFVLKVNTDRHLLPENVHIFNVFVKTTPLTPSLLWTHLFQVATFLILTIGSENSDYRTKTKQEYNVTKC